jgi:hypothetical protein
MKAHIGVDADSGLVHTVRGTSGNVADVTEGNSLLHGEETEVFGDAGIFSRSVLLTYFEESFTNPSGQRKATNCPDGTRTTDGHCLLE